jgi:molecular chaperone Hsp33
MADTDSIHRFLFEQTGIRGNLVHLDASWRAILGNHPYPEAIGVHLGQALAAVALLSATIKFDGSLILQVQGSGPLRTLVAQATSARTLRGIARWSGEVPASGHLNECTGEGRLVLTIERAQGEPYQGVVPLAGHGIGEALEHYFATSEQLPTRLWLAADEGRAAGLLLQRLPTDETTNQIADETTDDWDRIGMLAATVTPEELLRLSTLEVLHRLFHEEDVRLFEPEPLSYRCGCSRTRIEDMLRNLGEAEVNSMLAEQGEVEVTCEFCNRTYRLDSVDASQLFTPPSHHAPSTSQH